ncbi:MAG: hypothetical protein G8D58_08795 [gamma proteobacterium symbiont of Phacoides pectinatus]
MEETIIEDFMATQSLREKIQNKINITLRLLTTRDTAASKRDKDHLLSLLDDMNAEDDIHPLWISFCSELKNDAKKWSLNSFLNWKTIRKTMAFQGIPKDKYIQLSKDPLFSKHLSEHSFGGPAASRHDHRTSDNLLHHAWSLKQISGACPLETIDSVFEFGGGYGSMARLLCKINHQINYTIYDIPFFQELQKLYIKRVIGHTNNISWMKQIKPIQVDLMLSTWGLSEAPHDLRDQIIRSVTADHYLIAFQEKFECVDNITYFESLADALSDKFDIELTEIDYLPRNCYLLASRRRS